MRAWVWSFWRFYVKSWPFLSSPKKFEEEIRRIFLIDWYPAIFSSRLFTYSWYFFFEGNILVLLESLSLLSLFFHFLSVDNISYAAARVLKYPKYFTLLVCAISTYLFFSSLHVLCLNPIIFNSLTIVSIYFDFFSFSNLLLQKNRVNANIRDDIFCTSDQAAAAEQSTFPVGP